ncbi:NADP-dependent oxidoreductase [Novosphingobium marinum]|uniref:NADPH:quinone reductase-like Zn-dependent oxidoreductase n=1 Tax=Novosphingobium marinum TaxID=1514948 RepID=A0A7Z0BTP0_9SPHN|nr:zinc-binding alcohol dehydrogenase family protein [Novosphingobium marinum]NYH96216.1 NADPH:quinone reductase-like Zn-dependent oxidoreductase [Novosphingobium marinum]GGC33411.1 NADP-dependent oxidoreductase [Novosphingobium marinum]
MKAAWYTENGGPEVLEYGDLPDPEVGAKTVLVRVEWISIEGGDLLNRIHVPPRTKPFVPGYQAAGIVEAVGAEVSRFAVGDRVMAFDWNGSHAELFAVPEHYAYAVPDGIDLRLASTIPVPFGTAHDSLFEYGDVAPGETVLVQGAAGGVGLSAVQLAAKAGATVIGTASGKDRLARIEPFGLHHGIDYTSEDIAERCREITGGKGVDMVLDLAGGRGKDKLVEALRPHGRYQVIGAAEGTLPTFNFFELIRKAMRVNGISFGRDMHTTRVRDMLADLTSKVASGELQMPVEREFPLSQVREAHTFVAEGHPFGRVLMKP